jgi:hypothetical protein
MFKQVQRFLCFVALVTLAGCGGGGDGGTPTPVSTPLSISTAPLKNLRQIATSSTFSISGNCSGSGTENSGAPYATNLYGAMYGKTNVTTLNYTNCTGSGASTNNRYYDNNFSTLAILASDGKFTEGTVVNALPTTVKVGDTLTLSNLRTYANSSKSAQIQTGVQSIVVEADTNTSVIVNVITQIYDSSNRLSSTGQFRYRLSSNGQVKELIYKMDSPTGQTETWTYN